MSEHLCSYCYAKLDHGKRTTKTKALDDETYLLCIWDFCGFNCAAQFIETMHAAYNSIVIEGER